MITGYIVGPDDFDANCTLSNNDRHVIEPNTFQSIRTLRLNYLLHLSKWYANTKEQAYYNNYRSNTFTFTKTATLNLNMIHEYQVKSLL